MVELSALWLPILAAAAAVFVLSSVVWMVLPWHKNDYRKLPNEEAVRAAMGGAVPPGQYCLPHASGPEQWKDPEYLRKVQEGPVAMLSVMPNATPNMGANLGAWFLYSLVVGTLTAYVAGHSLDPRASFGSVLRLAGTVAVMGYALAILPGAIWHGRRWTPVLKEAFDGCLYGAATGLVFAALWPEV
ncbi:hypothetical protein Pla163_14000 [Planctomycetes bacterium Pla163]|uniref:Uncharacterized protein n=1 Tax=Rohdeia mirabilis TaxID=2528008 RepID=A0A518CYI6_9BACT|nr:hypothetical protein Pla163_14000 [Planctomycetes bacterium Pla163]